MDIPATVFSYQPDFIELIPYFTKKNRYYCIWYVMFKNQNATLHFTNEKNESRFLKYHRDEKT